MLAWLLEIVSPLAALTGASLAVAGTWRALRLLPPPPLDAREEWVRLVLRAGWSSGEYVDAVVHVVRTRDGWRVCWGGQAEYETVSTARLRVVLRAIWDEALVEVEHDLGVAAGGGP
jgi:hypothetical protein